MSVGHELTIGSLFTGYGGLDMALTAVLNHPIRLAWCADIEPGPSAIIARHHPGVPNLGDVTTIDWTTVEPVDIITGGSPCQDLSLAGGRAGMREGTRSGLWSAMCHAIEKLRPRFVVWENVLGALSARADSDMEPCHLGLGCEHPVSLRALGRVLGDLTEIGYDASWTALRASDVGAPHRRERIFLLAWPADVPSNPWRKLNRNSQPAARRGCDGKDGARLKMLPTPMASDNRGSSLSDLRRDSLQLRSLPLVLLPSLRTANNTNRQSKGYGPNLGETLRSLKLNPHAIYGTRVDWQEYEPTIRRWEQAFGRLAPCPFDSTGQLSPRFAEWMMGLPEGHVTDTPGLSRAQQIRALGNGVIPQQAAKALHTLMDKATT